MTARPGLDGRTSFTTGESAYGTYLPSGDQPVGAFASRATETITVEPSGNADTTWVNTAMLAGQRAPGGHVALTGGGLTVTLRGRLFVVVPPNAAPVQSASDRLPSQVRGKNAVAGSVLGGGVIFGPIDWTELMPIMLTIHSLSGGLPSRNENVTQYSPRWGGPMHGLAVGQRLMLVAVTALNRPTPAGSCLTAYATSPRQWPGSGSSQASAIWPGRPLIGGTDDVGPGVDDDMGAGVGRGLAQAARTSTRTANDSARRIVHRTLERPTRFRRRGRSVVHMPATSSPRIEATVP
jgi:hypothetical protein